MNLRTLLLAGAVFPFALSAPASAAQAEISPDRLILAQAEQPCPEGQECPPVEAEADANAEAGADDAAPVPEAEAEVAPADPADAVPAEQQLDAAPTAPVEAEVEAEVEADANAEAGADAAAPIPEAAADPDAVQPDPADAVPAEQQLDAPPAAEGEGEAEADAEVEVAPESGGEPQAGQGERRQRAQERAQRRQQELQQQDAEQQDAEQQDPAAQPAQRAAPAQDAAPADQAQQPAEQMPVEGQQQERQVAPTDQPVEQPAAAAENEADADVEAEADAAVEADADAAAEADSTVEQQLEAQGDDEEAAQIRELRQKLRQERRAAREAAGEDTEQTDADGEQTAEEEAGDRDRGDRNRDRADRRRDRDRGEIVERRGDRLIINLGGQIFVEPSAVEGDRLLYGARDVEVQELQGGLTRTIVYRENGAQIVTDRDAYGTIIQRVRVRPDGTQVILIDNQLRAGGPVPVILIEEELPPIVSAPPEYYIVDYGQSSPEQLQEVLLAPPVVELQRSYSLQEVTRNERVREAVPRIDLNTITFDFGSATINDEQFRTLEDLGFAMEQVIAENPDEVYLIEGHTDAVGSDYDNLILSDERAESVAVALSQNFDIPPENLVTEGYGEQYLAVDTASAEERNRRVTVRRITPLLAQAQ